MECPNCHREVEPGFTFCTYCGTKIEDGKQVPSQQELKHLKTCPVCHNPVEPGYTFCIVCGAKLDGTSGGNSGGGFGISTNTTGQNQGPTSGNTGRTANVPANIPATGGWSVGTAGNQRGMHAVPEPPKRHHTGAIVAVTVIVVLIVAAVAVLVAFGGVDGVRERFFGGETVEASYASADTVDVSFESTIVPMDEQGEPMTTYTVRVKQASDDSGEAIDIVDIPMLSVEGSGGFTIGDFGDLDEGSYLLCVSSDSGEAYDLPWLEVAEEGTGMPACVEVSVPDVVLSDKPLLSRGLYGCYLDTLTGAVDAYGDASLTVMKLADQQYLAWTAGVSYASLVDFGDGVERLVIVYCKDEKFAESDVIELSANESTDSVGGPSASDYLVEVWEYDPDADEAVRVGEMKPADDGEGYPILGLVENPSGGLCLRAGGQDVNGSDATRYYGVGDDGAFGALTVDNSTAERWETEENYRFVHSGTTQDAALGDAGENEASCEETAQTVMDLKSTLARAAGD